jgi:NADH-quinone oxidoreductase subunit M
MTAIVLLPLAGALSMFAVPRELLPQARIHALLAAGGTLALAIGAVGVFDRDLGGLQLVDHYGWAEDFGLAWDVGVDGISLWLVVLAAAIFLLVIAAACWRLPERPRSFLGLLLLAETGLLGLFVAGDLVLFYVFWEFMLIPFYFLIGTWGAGDRAAATLKFVIYTMVGSLPMLVAILATAFLAQDVTGQLTFNIAELRGVAFSAEQSTWLFAGFALAFAIKLPLWPFHAWLPDVYRAAPLLVTVLLAAVMSKAGVYGFLRIGVPLFPEGADRFALPLGVLAVIGIVYGSLVAWRAPSMRLLVGYSSLAHLGFILLGIMAFDLQSAQGAVLQMVSHGLVVAAAFVIVGVVARAALVMEDPAARRLTEDDPMRLGVDDVGGLARRASGLAGVFLLVAMAMLAIPGSPNFVGEFFILTGVFRHNAVLAVIAMLGVVYASVYSLRLYQTSMNGPLRAASPERAMMRPRDAMVLVPIVLAMLVLALWPAGIVGSTSATLEEVVAPAQAAAGRPVEEIAGPVPANPPVSALPLPGDAATPVPAP